MFSVTFTFTIKSLMLMVNHNRQIYIYICIYLYLNKSTALPAYAFMCHGRYHRDNDKTRNQINAIKRQNCVDQRYSVVQLFLILKCSIKSVSTILVNFTNAWKTVDRQLTEPSKLVLR